MTGGFIVPTVCCTKFQGGRTKSVSGKMYFQAHSDIDIALNYLGKTHMHTPPGFGIFKSAEKKKLCLVLQTLLCVALAYPTTKIRKSDET